MIKPLHFPTGLVPRLLLILLISISMLTGCTAASMQVEVEVYKGPLSKETDIQKAELDAYVKEAKQGLDNFKNFLDAVPSTIDGDPVLPKPSGGSPPIAEEDLKKLWKEIKESITDCWALTFNLICDEPDLIKFIKLKNFKRHVESLIDDAGNTDEIAGEKDDETIKKSLAKISDLGNRLKSSGFFWATNTTFSHESRTARKFLTDYSNMASQYGNQIESRADALHKQLFGHKKGIDRDELPLSAYIRDTSPTDFINLYSWNRASGLEIWENYLLHPIDSLSSAGTANRVRTFEHLFADQFWSSINKVYASGQGDVAMAFVKDEIGNWNLKSFDQDPSKILEAYTGMSLAAIKAVTEAFAKGATGGADISSGLKVIGRLTSGQIGSAGNIVQISELKKLRKNTLTQLNELSAKQQKREETKKEAPDEIKKIRKETIIGSKEILDKYQEDLKNLSIK